MATIGLTGWNAFLCFTLTNAAHDGAGTQTTSLNEIFIHTRSFSIAVYLIYLFSLFDKTLKIEKQIFQFFGSHEKAVVIIFFLAALTIILVKNYQDKKKPDYKTVFFIILCLLLQDFIHG